MNSPRKLVETFKERLERVSASSRAVHRSAPGPTQILLVGSFLLILSFLLTALVVGFAGTDIVAEYVRRLQE